VKNQNLCRHTRERWNELAAEGVVYSRPWLDLTRSTARQRVDPLGLLGELRNKKVLCLAGGGGQQSAAFGLLGAKVTVFDLSDEMLERDRIAARHCGHKVRLIQGDACDLSPLKRERFDVVWQGHSLPFIPDLDPLFDGVARVLRRGGLYHVSGWNPLAHGAEKRWTGKGYLLMDKYVEGAEVASGDGYWPITDAGGREKRVRGPREFRHTLTAILNGLIARGFVLLDVHEEPIGPPKATPGSWDHFTSIVTPWLYVWAAFRPDLLKRVRRGRPAQAFGKGE
jgi:SAM-dependent methyltransferase